MYDMQFCTCQYEKEKNKTESKMKKEIIKKKDCHVRERNSCLFLYKQNDKSAFQAMCEYEKWNQFSVKTNITNQMFTFVRSMKVIQLLVRCALF